LPLGVLGCRLDTRRPGRAATGVAAALYAAYTSRARVDVMVLELGVRAAGDMQAHLEVVRPDIIVVAPLAPSFSDDAGSLSTVRHEIDTLCRAGTASAVLMCTDDPLLVELAERMPAAVGFTRDDVVSHAGGLALRIDGTTWPLGRDAVGASQLRALSVAARAARLLGVSDSDIGAFLAG
jgi:UDP-N-acetylmuramyl pentapeptide synthase